MSEPPPDEIALLEELLEDLPDTGGDREQRLIQAVRLLAEFTGKGERPLPPGMEAIALRLTRKTLFDLYAGFRLGTFRGISSVPRAPGEPPATQIRLGERLKALLRVEAARAEMFRWFLAGLRHHVSRLLEEPLQTAPPIWEPRRLFVHWRGWLALALEEAFRTPIEKENPDHEFGLYGLHLLFSGSGEIRPHEFQVLCDLMSEWVESYPYFPELEISDLIQTIAQAPLSPEQIGELARRLHAWHDLERYPAERSLASYREFVRANAQAAGYGKAFIALAMLLAPLLRPRSLPSLGEEHRRYREQVNRRWRLASALASLALQDEGCIPALAEEIDMLLEMEALEAEWVWVKGLPAFLRHPSHLYRLQDILEHHRIQKFDDLRISDLQNLRLELSRPALETLLDLMRRFPDARWPLQILENVGKLSPTAEEWLSQQVPNAQDEILVTAALGLHQRLSQRREPPPLLESALRRRLERFLRENAPVPEPLVRWALGLHHEALRLLLSSLAKGVEDGSLPITVSLSTFLRTMADEVSHADRPNPVKLAACWLIDPDDGLHSGLALAERLAQAARMVQRNRFDETVAAWLARSIPTADSSPSPLKSADEQLPPPIERALSASPRLAAVLNEPIDHRQKYPMCAGASRRLALARALSHARSPEIALPLLADLFHLAAEMFLAWSRAAGMPRYFPELFWEANTLALEVLKAVVQLEPVLPQAVALLEEMLLTEYRMPEGGFGGTEFAPASITQNILPLLVNRRQIAPEAIPALVGLLQQEYPSREKYHQRIWQCALQWLSNVSTLDAEQQEVIWKVGYASPLILTRSLALLVLGRQRPLNVRTWRTVLSLLRTPWSQLYQRRAAEIRRLSDRGAWSILGPGDVFLVAGVAVALTAEWSVEPGLLNDEQRQELRQAWQRAASDQNLALEGKLAESTHPLLSAEWSSARSLALSLCSAVGYNPENDPDWLVRPADLARRLLQRFSLTKGDDHERTRIPSTDRRPAPLL